MPDIGVPVQERAAAGAQALDDGAVHEHRADRLVARAQAFRHGDQVGRHAVLLDRVHRAGAAHPAHDFVGDEQDAVLVAQRPHAAEVAGRGRDRAARRAHDRFGAERDHAVRTGLQDRRFQFVQQHRRVLVDGLVRGAAAVFIAGRHPLDVDQQRGERLAAPFVAPHGQRPKGIPVVALAPRDEQLAFGLPAFDDVLARQFQRRLHRLRSARHEVHALDAGRRVRHETVGQLLRHFGREERGVGVGALVDLAVHGRDHVRMAMSERRHGRAAAGVEVAAPVAVV